MTEMNTSNGVVETSSQTTTNNSSQPQVPTLKIVQNKTHIGPVAVNKRKDLNRLTKSSNKIRISSNLKVSVKSDPNSEITISEKKKVNPSTSKLIESSDNDHVIRPNAAILYMEAWDRLFTDAGTEDYVQKSTTLSKEQRRAYEELGINPDSKNKPELTEEQRSRYNAMVKPYAFDYYEVHLSYKVPQKRAVRSKTYRYTSVPELDQIIYNLKREAKYLDDKLEIKVKEN